jgi:predicted nucleic acid-binding Zn ribbon protein
METTNLVHRCKFCGKEIKRYKHFCDDCCKRRRKKYFKKPDVKEKRKKYMKEYRNQPGYKEKQKEYQIIYRIKHKEKQNTVKHCKLCGKEIPNSKFYCEECRIIHDKERRKINYYKPERIASRKAYYSKPEVKQRIKNNWLKYREQPKYKERLRANYIKSILK